MKTIVAVSVAVILAALCAPCMAQEVKIGPDRYAFALARADLTSATPASARRALQRIDRAATAACGGFGGRLREVTNAVRASACWRGAVSDTVRGMDSPLLTQAWQDQR